MISTMLQGATFSGVPIPPAFLFLAAIILTAIWAIYSVIIRYHWKQYGTSALETSKMSVIYFAGSGILLAGMLIFAAVYLASTP